MPAKFRLVQGDIMQDKGVPFIPVNCVAGVMGAGLAKAYANKYPGLKERHAEVVNREWMWPGQPVVLYDLHPTPPVLFPTKKHWRDPSRYEYIADGLYTFSDMLIGWSTSDPTDLALPSLGCGLGGLDYRLVHPLIEAWARMLPDRFSVTLYHTHESSK